jgi:hypothetical protein
VKPTQVPETGVESARAANADLLARNREPPIPGGVDRERRPTCAQPELEAQRVWRAPADAKPAAVDAAQVVIGAERHEVLALVPSTLSPSSSSTIALVWVEGSNPARAWRG